MKMRIPNSTAAARSLVAATLTLSALSGLCGTPTYPSVVIADGALGYYRFNDSLARTDINVNSGSLGAAGNATNDLEFVTGGVVHSFPGAIAGDPDRAEFFDFTARTEIPFNSALNTPNTQPFTVEGWFYPANDQDTTDFGGMGAIANRWTQGGNRQGWVMYQRRPNTDYIPAAEGVGWEFRMYNDLDGSGHLDVVSQVPFELGKWQHVVVVYEPIGGDPTNSTVTIYINGLPGNTNINTSPIPGYAPCTGDHSPAPNGQPAMSLGGYNNANSGTYGFANPWFGAVDEFAWYSNKLSPAQILAHYQNGTNAARSTPYATLIRSDNPVVYLRLDEVAPGRDTDVNLGDTKSIGDATNTAAIKHPGTSALAGRTDDGSLSGHLRDVGSSGHAFADIPWTADNNPDASVPFTIEVWARPTSDNVNNGPALINNRLAGSATDRT